MSKLYAQHNLMTAELDLAYGGGGGGGSRSKLKKTTKLMPINPGSNSSQGSGGSTTTSSDNENNNESVLESIVCGVVSGGTGLASAKVGTLLGGPRTGYVAGTSATAGAYTACKNGPADINVGNNHVSKDDYPWTYSHN